MFIVQAYYTSQYVAPRGGIFLDKWLSSFAGNSDGKMNVQSACALKPCSAPWCSLCLYVFCKKFPTVFAASPAILNYMTAQSSRMPIIASADSAFFS
jgi:hypothetical protein